MNWKKVTSINASGQIFWLKKEFFHPTCVLGPRNGFCSHHGPVLVKPRTGDVCSSYERTGHGLAQMWLPDILLVTSWCKQAEQYINFTGEQVVHAQSLRSGHTSNVISRLAVITQKGGSHFANDLGTFFLSLPLQDIYVHFAAIQKWCMRNQDSNFCSVLFRLSTCTHISDRSSKSPDHPVGEWIAFNLFHWRNSACINN